MEESPRSLPLSIRFHLRGSGKVDAMKRLRGIEALEPRTLLSASVAYHHFAVDPTSGVDTSSAAEGYASPPAGR